MRAKSSMPLWTRGFFLGLALLAGWARAQDATQAADSPTAWQQYDWLKPAEEQQSQVASGETFHSDASQDVSDPFTVLSTGALWQEKYGQFYSRRLDDALTLSCETSTVTLDEDSDDLSRSQKFGLYFQPLEGLSLGGDLHDTTSDAPILGETATTSGAGFSAESHLPFHSTLTLDGQSDRTASDAPSGTETQTSAYDAEIRQPIGQLPLSAILKGHYEGTSTGGAPATSLPSLEQSFIWKPLQTTTLQMGLRQQQYQEYPGIDHELNEALFADWSQKIVEDVSWHSYAEVLNSRGLLDQAPAAPIASGANGTPQATTPGSNANLTSSLPLSIDDQTLTFSTGPSFKVEKDISASVEYSNRWDKNPAPGGMGDEQRVSVSLKGTF